MDKVTKTRILTVIKYISAIAAIEIAYYISVVIKYGKYECPISKTFGLECPGCGGTRMIKSLLNFDIYQAFRWNPYLFITLPILAIAAIKEIYNYIKLGKLQENFVKLLTLFAATLLVFGIVRNIPGMEFLLPTKISK